MGKGCTNRAVRSPFAPGKFGGLSRIPTPHARARPELQKYLFILGPTPKRCLEQLADLGMSDDEIGRYFRMPCRLVTELREMWKIDGSACRI